VCESALDSNASGNACKKEVASIIPTEKLTSRSTTLDKIEKEKIAAADKLMTPAIVAVSNIESNVE
jgi:hypothetical protein